MRHQSRLIIDLSAIAHNYNKIKHYVGEHCDVGAVVKANAYGLGVEHIIPTLEQLGCRQFYVATPAEGYDARQITNTNVAILNPYLDYETAAFLVEHDLTPCLNTLDQIITWNDICQAKDVRAKAFIQLDTGMRRVGLSLEELSRLSTDINELSHLNIDTIMTHFASADDPASPMTATQDDTFKSMLDVLPYHIVANAKICVANSAATALSNEYHYNSVRPGKSLFGLKAIEEFDKSCSFKSPITLEARVIQVLDVKAGEPIGYNETYTALDNMKIATISLGYADGLRRHLSNKGWLLFEGQKLPIVGRVSMDMVMVRIDHLGQTQPKLGDWVQFLNDAQTPDDIARLIGTNGYEILTGLGRRASRIYLDNTLKRDHTSTEITRPLTDVA